MGEKELRGIIQGHAAREAGKGLLGAGEIAHPRRSSPLTMDVPEAMEAYGSEKDFNPVLGMDTRAPTRAPNPHSLDSHFEKKAHVPRGAELGLFSFSPPPDPIH